MNLVKPILFLLLILILPFGLIVHQNTRRFLRRFSRYANEGFAPLYLSSRSTFYSRLKLVLMIIAFTFITIALVRPQWDYRDSEFPSGSRDIIFAIDISRSMNAEDIAPNRLLRSILHISAFVEELADERIGIISFAGAATLECPLTDDHEAVKMVLNGLSTESAVKPGTDIGRALDLVSTAFEAGETGGVLILISDGEDIAGNAFTKAKDLASMGVRIYTLGVGSPDGAIVTHPLTGAQHLSRLDVKSLEKIAHIGEGKFYQISPSSNEIKFILSHIRGLEEGKLRKQSFTLYKEQYHIFALIALFFLILESLIIPLKNGRRAG